jgi:CheY-like chemotaxis protein
MADPERPVAAAVSSGQASVDSLDDEAEEARALKVLVVDDHDINRRAVQLILAPLGCDVTSAEDGMSALIACQAEAFDLIFMDVRMPELDGRETTRRLRASGGPNAAVPVIAVTADTSPEDVEACLAAGMNYFVPKPITPQALLGAVQHVLAQPDAAAEAEAAAAA